MADDRIISRGPTTTEFWLTALVIALGAVGQIAGVLLGPDHPALSIITILAGTVAEIAAVLGYQVSRNGLKKKELEAGALLQANAMRPKK